MFEELEIKGTTYKLRLTTKTGIQMEKALGYNPISMLMKIDEGEMPKLGDLLIMLQYMLLANHHGMNADKVYDLFDDFVEEGHNMFDLIPIFINVFQNSGYIAKADNTEEEKN